MRNLSQKNQSAFVAHRHTHDNIIVTQEVFHYMRLKKRGKKYELALKLDMNKAYDHVEWDFLEVVLRIMGFEEIWIGWIMDCVKSESYSLVLNGELSSRICSTRGIRQGDLVFLSLFLLMSCQVNFEKSSSQGYYGSET